jgi:hypothetical protein
MEAETSSFMEAEDQEILTLQRTKGSRWASIAKELRTNRTGDQIRSRSLALAGIGHTSAL